MKKLLSSVLLTAISLFAADKMPIIEQKESYVNCVLSNLEQDKDKLKNFISTTPKEKLTYQTLVTYFKDYQINLLKEDTCSQEFDIYLESTVDWNKKLSSNPGHEKPADFDFAAEGKNLIIDLTASSIYFSHLVKN